MEKSGKRAIPSPNPKPKQSTATSPLNQDDSKQLSPQLNVPVTEMTIPAPHDGLTKSDRDTQKFLARYKVGKRQWETCPKISDIIQRAIGGRNQAIEKLKFSKNADAVKLMEFCEKLAWSTREKIPIEALCLAAGVDITTIAGALVLAARDTSRLESTLITLEKHPDVVRATAFYAGLADNSKDREMFHKAAAVGWLPQPKGSSINVNVFDPKQHHTEDEDEIDGIPTIEGVFDSDPMEIENWGENRRRLLEAGK
jgi:hypothetical protein